MKKRKSGIQPSQNPKLINLAFQGGGAHGAYTWGVLDRLLESDRIEISAIGCTNAGAMNASRKMNTEREFLDHLHNLGYRTADDWLEVNFDRLGKSSSVNVRGLLHGCYPS